MQHKMPVRLILLLIVAGSIFLFARIVKSANTDIIINEIGAYESTGYEWLEIWNKGNGPISLDGWKFVEDGANHGLSVSTTDNVLAPGEYGAICQDENKFLEKYPGFSGSIFDSAWGSLKEDGEAIGLKDNEGNWAEALFVYPPAANYSLERISADIDASSTANWQEHPAGSTLGQVNYWTSYVPPANQPPIAVINGPTSTIVGETAEFDGGDSSDADGSVVSYQWLVGEERISSSSTFNYQFFTSGIFTVSLQITDDQGAGASTSLNILVVNTQTPDSDNQPNIVALYINEFLPNSSTSSEHEWIELFNPATSTVDLTGWTLSDSTGVRSSPTGTISNEGFFVIELSNVLNNTGDTIILKNPAGEIKDTVIYGNNVLSAPAKGNSIARSADGAGSWQETTTVTKGLSNIITAPVQSSPSTGSGQGGGGGSQTPPENLPATNLNSTGQIIINELLPNPKGSDTENEFIELKNMGTEQVNFQDWIIADASSKYKIREGTVFSGGFIVFKRSITNLALNNSGNETVKLYNPAGALIDQIKYAGPAGEDESYVKKSDGAWAWTTKLTPGTENIFAIKNLPPVVSIEYMKEAEVGETAVFDASDTYDPDGDVLQFVWTTGSEEKNGPNVSFVFERAGDRVVEFSVDDGQGNRETKKLKITVVRNEETDGDKDIGGNVGNIKNGNAKTAVKSKTSVKTYRPLLAITLDKIKDREIGDRVKVNGVVAVLPGILGTQYFYIVNSSVGLVGSSPAGVQVYSNKKDFPKMRVGDKVEVVGELSQAYGEWRVKTKEKGDIKVIGFDAEPQALAIDIDDINEAMVGSLVTASGEITELKASNLYLDDGTNEIKVYFKKGAGINKKNYKLGETVKVTGIVGINSSGLQLVPRGGFDIEKKVQFVISADHSEKEKSSSNAAETYLTVTAGGLTSILISLFAKARGRMALGLIKNMGRVAWNVVKRSPRV